MLALLLFALQGVTAEEAMAGGRAMMRATPPDCPAGPGGDIVVCGRRTPVERYRLPLPEELETADAPPPRGERPAASASNVRQGGCGIALQGQRCSSGLSAARFGAALLRAARALVDPDSIAEPDEFRKKAEKPSRHPDSALNPY